ncbi:hypothetical protein [Nocardia sp. NPDC058633]|uniref:hypothetical protein n=1 Tax=Nocardia sp. NPDC058633 TaxID=3346568 RepID=UPI00366A3237
MPTDIPLPRWAPTSCTLPSTDIPLRVAEFDQFFTDSVLSWDRPTPVALELVLPQTAEAAGRDLATRESACCSFFTFSFEQRATASVVMRISVPTDRITILDAIEARVRAAPAAHVDGT